MQGTIGEIRMFAGNFAPESWAFCRGQVLDITDYPILYDLIGITFGGDGIDNFALPDFRGRSPIGVGQGTGLSDITDGETGGAETVTLTTAQMPQHNHTATATVTGTVSPYCLADGGFGDDPSNAYMAVPETGRIYTSSLQAPDAQMAPTPIAATATVTIGNTGTSSSVPTRNPFAAINYIICIEPFVPSP